MTHLLEEIWKNFKWSINNYLPSYQCTQEWIGRYMKPIVICSPISGPIVHSDVFNYQPTEVSDSGPILPSCWNNTSICTSIYATFYRDSCRVYCSHQVLVSRTEIYAWAYATWPLATRQKIQTSQVSVLMTSWPAKTDPSIKTLILGIDSRRPASTRTMLRLCL